MDRLPGARQISFLARLLFLSFLLPLSLAGEEGNIFPIPLGKIIDASLYNVEAKRSTVSSTGPINLTLYQNTLDINDERLGQAYSMLDSGVFALFSQGSPQAFIGEFGLPWSMVSFEDSQGRVLMEQLTYRGLLDDNPFSIRFFFFYFVEAPWGMSIQIMYSPVLEGLLFDNRFHLHDSQLDLVDFYPEIQVSPRGEIPQEDLEDCVYYEESPVGVMRGILALSDRGFVLHFDDDQLSSVSVSNYYVKDPALLGEIRWEE